MQMDDITKQLLNDFFVQNFSGVYKSKPELKSIDKDFYYLTNKDSNIICLIPFTTILTGLK